MKCQDLIVYVLYCRQPLMQAVENIVRALFPNVAVLNYEVWYDVPLLQHVAVSPLMLISRTIIVVTTTIIVSPHTQFPLLALFTCKISKIDQ